MPRESATYDRRQIEDALNVLGNFVTAGNSGRRLQAKLKIHDDGRFEYQQSGLATWWNRGASDSLTNAAVNGAVTNMFTQCRTLIGNMGNNGEHKRRLYWKMLYGLRGYHTLIKEGYPSLRENFEQTIGIPSRQFIGNATSLGMGIALGHFGQSDFLRKREKGLCWGFTLDWLRRCFRGRYTYNQTLRGPTVNNVDMKAKVNRKLDQIREHQAGQTLLKAQVEGGSLQINEYIEYDFGPGGPAGVGPGKFAGMVMHPRLNSVNIEVEQQRFYGNVNNLPDHQEQDPFRMLQAEMNSWYMGPNIDRTDGIGWIISMEYDNFWEGPANGHAIGAFWERRGTAMIFDPNSGYNNLGNEARLQSQTAEWIKKIVVKYTMVDAAVKAVVVYPVTFTPPANA